MRNLWIFLSVIFILILHWTSNHNNEQRRRKIFVNKKYKIKHIYILIRKLLKTDEKRIFILKCTICRLSLGTTSNFEKKIW